MNEYIDGKLYSNIEIYHDAINNIIIDDVQYNGVAELLGIKMKSFYGERYNILAFVISSDSDQIWNRYINREPFICRKYFGDASSSGDIIDFGWKSFGYWREELPVNANINMYKVVGKYQCSASDLSRNIQGIPEGLKGIAFTMDVDSGIGVGNFYPRQTLRSYTNAITFTRTLDSNTNEWGEWIQYITTVDTNAVVGNNFYGVACLHHCSGAVHSISVRGTLNTDLKANTEYPFPSSGWCKKNGGGTILMLNNGMSGMLQLNETGATFTPTNDIPKGTWIIGSCVVLNWC